MTVLKTTLAATVACAAALPAFAGGHDHADTLSYGVRPFYLIDRMEDGPLKEKLASCKGQSPKTSLFSIGHRGAPMQFPEHTVESNIAAARQGAGILECDVTFTKDKELVCRHAQNDLHTTTNILASKLAENCTQPFVGAAGGEKAKAECRTSDITLAEYKGLIGKMDAANKLGTTVEDYMNGTANWRTDLYSAMGGTVMTHAESIALFKDLGAKFTPELKSPSVEMPFDGFSMNDYAQKMIDEYKAAGVPASDVWAQSFDLDVVKYWIDAEPEFGAQAVYLMDEYNIEGYSPMDAATWPNTMEELKAMGVNYIAPPMWMLVTAEGDKIVASELAKQAKAADLKIITWTLERSGPLGNGGGWYFQSVKDLTDNDADYFNILNALHEEVGVEGVFSDWPATVTYYANCMGI
ncbi:MAG: glycerophosphodiester phosphodiesterase family protein [Pelagimonas sp.]|jgi:glycerophosphoryl diester phosphodiesterase|nr:glycerophosphodiester phosphodiesterase family protein [Pelagimonas sp.]